MHHLQRSEAQAVFEQVVGNKDLAGSIISGYTPSINFAIDEVLMAHRAYQAAYGSVYMSLLDFVGLSNSYSVVRLFPLAHRTTSLQRNGPQALRK